MAKKVTEFRVPRSLIELTSGTPVNAMTTLPGATAARPMIMTLKLPKGLRQEVKDWLEENCKGHWEFEKSALDGIIRFRLERDAMLFKVTWL